MLAALLMVMAVAPAQLCEASALPDPAALLDAPTADISDQDADVARRRALLAAAFGLAPWGGAVVVGGAATAALCGLGFGGCLTAWSRSFQGQAGAGLSNVEWAALVAGLAGLVTATMTLILLPLAGPVAISAAHGRRAGSVIGLLWWVATVAPALLSIPLGLLAGVAATGVLGLGGCLMMTDANTRGARRESVWSLWSVGAGLGASLWAVALAQFALPAVLHAGLAWYLAPRETHLAGSFPAAAPE
ncbi:MAG: hypothetical protein HY904_02150 [Deltaproteobacteria bacterium]|nr:hypothetical protein [Deltaproteobacteria bacterium]